MNNSRYQQDDAVQKTSKSKPKSKLNVFKGNKYLWLSIYAFTLTLIVGYQGFEQHNLKTSLIYAHKLINNNDDANLKVAVIAFKPTIDAWHKVDPTGKTVRKLLNKTIEAYNSAGYVILDSEMIVGGVGNAKFIDLSPEAVKNE